MKHMSCVNAGVIAAVLSLTIAVGVIRSFLDAQVRTKLFQVGDDVDLLFPALSILNVIALSIVLVFVSIVCSFRKRNGRLLIYTCLVLMSIIYVLMPALRPPRS